MAQATLEQALEIVARLSGDELRQVQRAVERRLGQDGGAAAASRFHRALEESGLVRQIKKPTTPVAAERFLVDIQGKPLSETIVEDRR